MAVAVILKQKGAAVITVSRAHGVQSIVGMLSICDVAKLLIETIEHEAEQMKTFIASAG